MLSAMRRNRRSVVIKVVLIGVALSFILGFGALGYITRTSARDKAVGYAAVVNGVQITRAEYERALRNRRDYYRQILGDNFEQFAETLNLPQQTLDALIDRVLLFQAAQRMGLSVSDAEVRGRILGYPAFRREDGAFDRERYENILRRSGLSATEFEESQREDLLVEKMQEFLAGFVKVSEEEIMADYRLNATKADFRFVEFEAARFRAAVSVTDAEARAYFDAHKADFRIPEKRRARLLAIDTEALAKELTASDAEIVEYYAANKEARFTRPEEVRASHILRRLAPDASPEVKAKTEDLVGDLARRAREGADFAQLAREFSEDETNRDGGGDLGYFPRGRMEPAFEEAAFAASPGEVVGPVTTSYGLHVIKVTDKRPAHERPLEEVREEAAVEIQKQKAAEEAERKIRDLSRAVAQGRSLTEVGTDAKLDVTLTDLIARTDRLPDLDGGWQVVMALFALSKEGQIASPVKAQHTWYLVELAGIEPEHEPAYEEVAAAVREKVGEGKETELARKEAEALLALAREKGLEEAAREQGREVQRTGLVALRGDTIPHVGASREAKEVLFALTPERSLPDRTFAVGGKVYVFELASRENPTDDGLARVRDELAERLRQQKARERVRIWQEEARKAAKIEYGDVLRPRREG